jgi:hypothetical protein
VSSVFSCLVIPIDSRLAWLGDAKGLDMLLEYGEDIELNGTDDYGNSPLLDAMYNHMMTWREDEIKGAPGRWLWKIRLLLAHGAKLNKKDGKCWATHHRGIPKKLSKDFWVFSKKEDINNQNGMYGERKVMRLDFSLLSLSTHLRVVHS